MVPGQSDGAVVLACGGVVRRVVEDRLVIAVVTRNRHIPSEISLPMGKLTPADEDLKAAAIREIREETGCPVDARELADATSYRVGTATKVVLFWLMDVVAAERVVDGDEDRLVSWVDPRDAADRLTHSEQRTMLESLIARGCFRKPPARGRFRFGWRPDPQARRLLEEIDAVRGEAENLAATDTSRPIALTMLRHVEGAQRAADRADTDAGWGQIFRARETQVRAYSPAEVTYATTVLRAEVETGDKLKPWRKNAIRALLDQAVGEGESPATDADERSAALRRALQVRNEAFANEYRALTILRRHQRRLLVIGGVALLAVVGLFTWRMGGSADYRVGDSWVLWSCLLMGIVGAATSAAQRSTTPDAGSRIPQRLSSHVASASRVPIGAVAGLLVWLSAQTGAAPAAHGVAYVLLVAFGSGFAERLIAPGGFDK